MLSKKFALCQKQAASLIYLTLLRMDFFEAAHRWVGGGGRRGGGKKAPLFLNLSHISYNNETWHSYT